MKIWILMGALLGALGLLAGCTKGKGSVDERVGKLEAENAELKQKVASLSTEFRTIEQRTDQMDVQNRTLEKMLALAEQDLRSRLLEMVQQEMGAGGRAFGGPRLARPAALPKPYLGFDAETHTAETAQKLGVPAVAGIVVSEVAEGAPADVAGLRKGDILQTLDEKPVKTREELAQIFTDLKPGQECKLGVLRGDERMKLNVKVGAR